MKVPSGDVDILEELLVKSNLIPEGEYEGKILLTELKITAFQGHPYWMVKILLDCTKEGRITWATLGGGPSFHTLMRFAAPRLVGVRIKAIVDHRQHGDNVYHDVKIKEYLDA